MDNLDILIVGPADGTGGIAQYISGQTEHLSGRVRTRTHDVSVPDGSGPYRFVIATLITFFDMLRFPFRSRPDVVHVHTSHWFSFYQSTFYVLFAKHVWGRPVILHVHGSSFDEFVATDSWLLSWLQSAVYDASDVVIVLSDYWRDSLSSRVATEKLLVFPNAVSTDRYEPSFSADPPRIVFVSNHIERKGIVELVEAVDALASTAEHAFEVSIAGKGELSHHAERLADRLPNVEYHGYVSEPEKRELLSRSSIYVLPTYAEGLPVALLEGMAGGNAVVSTDVGSIPEVIDTDGGRIVRPGSADELTAALSELLTSPAEIEQMARRNRTLVESKYDWNQIVERLVQLYGELANADGQPPRDDEAL